MSDFQITKVLSSREWSPPDEPQKVFVYYDILFEGDQGRADDLSKPASWKTTKGDPAPVEGETLSNVEIVSKNGKVELKPIRRGGGGFGGSKAKMGDYRSPEQIMRGWAHTHALQWLEVKARIGKLEDTLTFAEYTKLVDGFFEDVKGAA